MIKQLLWGVAFSALSLNAQAESRYTTWSNPDVAASQSGQVSDMIKELRSLVTEAEKARAADPMFLQDLKNLAARYEGTFQKVLISDDFIDGNFTANPQWKVASGKYWVERGYGLRSFVEAETTNTSSSQNSQKVSREELIIGVLGAVLGGQAQQSGNSQQQNTQTTTQAAPPAEIYLPHRISNAFAMKMDLSSWKENGHLEIGVYQGSNRNTGYRLLYKPGQNPALQLLRNYSSSSSLIDRVENLKLEDQKFHTLELQRSKSGEMKVVLDGKTIMSVLDRSFRDDFAGIVLKNISGDYIVKSVSVSGS